MKGFYLHLRYIRYTARFFVLPSIESNQPAVVTDAS